ncbi:type II secretion system protein N [Pseudomonas akapageensis]|uniref:type II secretion system protein N n=1 Tax=Pseudomonas akapageensis TaxID=2609961 RepID=UPI001FE6E049|nr:type II secretion system protein N [Pseudomonas akapageensis]
MKMWKGLPWITPVLIAGSLLAWREKAFRDALVTPVHTALTTDRPASIQQPLAGTAITLAFGLSPPGQATQSAENLKLKACFVSSLGDSRALLADSTTERIYRVGDRLPGGSVLRRIEYQSVVLWRSGREEVLPLVPSGERLFRAVRSDDTQQAAPAPTLFFQSYQLDAESR